MISPYIHPEQRILNTLVCDPSVFEPTSNQLRTMVKKFRAEPKAVLLCLYDKQVARPLIPSNAFDTSNMVIKEIEERSECPDWQI
jgi:hypothetical protein